MLKYIALILTLSFGFKAQGATLQEAEAAYRAGDYAASANDYLEYVQQNPPNASVFHNLGLAYDREKKLGPAIAAYLRAAQLRPRDADFQYNLHFLLGEAQDKLDATFARPLAASLLADQWLSAHELFYLTILMFLLTSLMVALAFLKRNLRKASLAFASVFGLIVLYTGSSFIFQKSVAHDLGAVSSPTLSAYSGPSQSVVIFELHEGAPFQILEANSDWVKIELSDQKRGWVRRAGVISFGRDLLLPSSDQSSKS